MTRLVDPFRARCHLALLVGMLLMVCQATGVAYARRIPVVRCPTTTGVSGPLRSTPPQIQVPGAPRGVVAYTNSEQFLVGPSSMQCDGQIGADGGAVLAAWPVGASKPGLHSHHSGITLTVIPACVGCKAEVVCPFFAGYASSLGFPCRTTVPLGERVVRPKRGLALFHDPSGVSGDGWPSGGPDAADGVVGFTRAPYGGVAYRATCTLPGYEHRVCSAVLRDVIRRYG